MGNLKNLRKERGLTQEQLGEMTMTSKQYISNLETGIRDIESIKVDTLNRLCAALNCTQEELLATPELEYDSDDNLIVDKLLWDERVSNKLIVMIGDKFYLIPSNFSTEKRTADELTPIKNRGYEKAREMMQSEYAIRNLVPRGGYVIELGRAITPEEFDEIKKRYSLGEDDISNEFMDKKGSIYGANYRKTYMSVQIRLDPPFEALSLEEELKNKGIEAFNVADGRLNIRVK